MNQLQKSLFLNAIFSGISGIILSLFSKQFANWFAVSNSTVFLIVGLALIFFALTILYEMKKQRPLGVLWIIIQDISWVLISIILLLFNPFLVSSFGNLAIFIVAVIVLVMALNQSRALALIDTQGGNPSLKILRFARVLHASKSDVWKVISDVENYHKVAPNIDSVKIISGKAEGMVRSCSHGKDSWTETCTLWQEEKKYSFAVDTNQPKYPYPFASLKGTWEVESLGGDSTNVILLFEFEYRYTILNVIAHPFLRGKFAKIVDELFDNWQSIIGGNNS